MSDTLDMTKKYQEYYNSILSGTLSDTIIKSISFQANIKLANDVIAENEKMISELQKQIKESKEETNRVKSDFESLRVNRNQNESQRINSLEKTIRDHLETISKLNSEVSMMNKFKNENESLKNQSSNVEIFRNELIKERDNHALTKKENELTKKEYEIQIKELNDRIFTLENPPRKKKMIKTIDEPQIVQDISLLVSNMPEETIVKDGGNF